MNCQNPLAVSSDENTIASFSLEVFPSGVGGMQYSLFTDLFILVKSIQIQTLRVVFLRTSTMGIHHLKVV